MYEMDEQFERFFGTFIENLAPNNPVTNNIFAPIVQTATGEAWYGEDIVPTRLQSLPAAEQSDEKTDAFSKFLGEKLGISPYKINYFLNQYSGIVGDVLLPMITPKAENGSNSFGGKLMAPIIDQFTTDAVINSGVPGKFYEAVDRAEIASNSAYATDEDKVMYKFLSTVSYDVSELYRKKREIQNSELPDSEKYAQTKEIQRQINETLDEALNRYEFPSVYGSYASVGGKEFHKDPENGKWYENTQTQKYQAARAVGGYSSYSRWNKKITSLHADKDSNGEYISGSRKSKVYAYIDGLKISNEKKYILRKLYYNSDRSHDAEIIEYVNGLRNMSKREKEKLFRELGFTVKDGKVY